MAELCGKHGVSDASIYKWKAKFGGMDVSEAKRLKALEDENVKLKRLLADGMLDNAALPEDAGVNKSFNGKLRDEKLNEPLFTTLHQARVELSQWKHGYNAKRTHSAFGWLTPAEFATHHARKSNGHGRGAVRLCSARWPLHQPPKWA